MKADAIIEKFKLRENRIVRGVAGQKMDEACIQKLVDGDPSGHGKYLEWMLYQAGGGKSRLDRSVEQWERGEHGEPSLREQLRTVWIKSRTEGYTDDEGVNHPPVSVKEARSDWDDNEDRLKWFNVYGDEEYIEQGCFGFYRSWPGGAELYSTIVRSVQRFHKHLQALKASGKSTDLSLKNYPNLTDLLSVLKDITAAELKADIDYDLVYSDDFITVVCPYNIGASLKFGICKWCTSNESMFLGSLSGEGKDRWKEHAEVSALYYCHFKNMPGGKTDKSMITDNPVKFVAVQIQHTTHAAATNRVAYALYWDANDKSNALPGFLDMMGSSISVQRGHVLSFKAALNAIEQHYATFDHSRVVCRSNT